jgi:hypothetical protein
MCCEWRARTIVIESVPEYPTPSSPVLARVSAICTVQFHPRIGVDLGKISNDLSLHFANCGCRDCFAPCTTSRCVHPESGHNGVKCRVYKTPLQSLLNIGSSAIDDVVLGQLFGVCPANTEAPLIVIVQAVFTADFAILTDTLRIDKAEGNDVSARVDIDAVRFVNGAVKDEDGLGH